MPAGPVAPTGGGAFRRPPRFRTGAALLAVLHLGTACQASLPVAAPPPPGRVVSFELTDTGRLRHAPAIGPAILRVAGTVHRVMGDSLVVDVASVKPVRGPELPVSGVRIAVASSERQDLRERRLSKRRTAWTVGVVLATVVTFVVTKGFRAGYTPPEGPPGSGGPDQ